jgi:hypothetical protein
MSDLAYIWASDISKRVFITVLAAFELPKLVTHNISDTVLGDMLGLGPSPGTVTIRVQTIDKK